MISSTVKRRLYTKREYHLITAGTRLFLFIISLVFTLTAYSQDLTSQQEINGKEAAAILSEYVSYPSVSGNEKPAGEFMAEQCRERGLFTRIFTDTTDSYNFAASLYPLELNKPNIIFLSHIDVVHSGAVAEWDHPPFSGDIFRDTVWGRGTLDMKGAAAMELVAASSFVERADTSDLPVNITLLFVSGEETFGSKGARVISESYLGELNPLLVIGEGGAGVRGIISSLPDKPVFLISLSHKRVLWLKLSLHYESSGHGAIPPDQYANKLMINSLGNITCLRPAVRFNNETLMMLKTFGSLEKGLKGFVLGKPRIFKPIISGNLRKDPLMLSTVTNTITITKFIDQGTGINQIPQDAEVLLDCRLLPETSTTQFLEFLKRKLDNDDINIEVVEETQNASPTKADRYFTLFGEAITETYNDAAVVPILFPATTDNNFFRAKGVPVLGIIPVCLTEELIGTIHNVNERIPVENLARGTEIYRLLIEKIIRENSQPPSEL